MHFNYASYAYVCVIHIICVQYLAHIQVVHITGMISGNTKTNNRLVGFYMSYNFLSIYHCTDILDVFPRNGSTEGGTQISITLNVPIFNNSDNVKVLVGGESIAL